MACGLVALEVQGNKGEERSLRKKRHLFVKIVPTIHPNT